MSSSRVEDLEETLGLQIQRPVLEGTSLEKYQANLDGQRGMLRIFSDTYYGNRYLREGLALRYLTARRTSFRVPDIIEEWPEYNIRLVKWIDMKQAHPSDIDLSSLLEEFENFNDFRSPFSLEHDITQHLENTGNIQASYREPFENLIEIILEQMDWSGRTVLVHGDFHIQNLGIAVNEQPVVFDWEYASTGHYLYDQAYFKVMQDLPCTETLGQWYALATAVITHWYLQKEDFSPKQAINWYEKLKTVTRNLDR